MSPELKKISLTSEKRMSFLQECIDNVDPELFDELIEIKNEIKSRKR